MNKKIAKYMAVFAGGSSTPTNRYGKQYEGIALNGVQGNNVVTNNTIRGVQGSRQSSTKTWGVVTRREDGRDTRASIRDNRYSRRDSNNKRL